MANNQNNVQPKVVTTTTTTTSRRGRRRRRRATRTSQAGTTTVRKVTTTRQPARARRRRRNRFGANGKSAPGSIRQRITATLGTVGSNQGESIELEMSTLLNPALMKETTGSNQYGPLQIHASTYSLWKVDYLLLKLTPLVGSSAVSGTACRASFNLSGQPGSPSWSALGARKHKDTNPGRPMTFYLSGNDIKGPKEGWFYCNTKNDPKMCIAGTLEIHTLGKTMSTYKNEAFNGPLFLVELTGQWSFKNYNPQPGMLNLVKAELKEQPQEVKINSKPGEPINISVPANAALARTVGLVDLGVNAGATPADIIWQVADTTMDVVTGAFPPPFQWLFRAGWWFLKRIANRKQGGQHVEGEPDAGEVTFQVYQSMTDAMNDTPCIATGPAKSTNTVVTGWNITQITPGNVGQPQATAATPRMIGLDTTRPFYLARTDVAIGEKPIIGFNYNSDYGVPLNGFSIKDLTSEKKVHSYLTYELENPFFYQDAEIDPSTADVPTYPMLKKTASNFEPIGTVYATSGIKYSSDPEIKWQLVLWKASKTVDVTRQPNNNVNLEFFTLQTTLTQTGRGYPTTTYSLKVIRSLNPAQEPVAITSGRWYITVFTALGGRVEFTNYGAEYPFPTTLYPGGERSYDPTPAVFHSGMALNTAVPLQFVFPREGATSVTLSMVHQMVQQALAEREIQDLPPPLLSESDNLEMPPLEGEEEEEHGATGGQEEVSQQRSRPIVPIMKNELQKDVENWIEFGHRKRPPTPFSPIEEEESEDEDSDLDDDDYAEPPVVIKNLLTPEAKDLYGHLRQKGLSHEQATNAAQAAFPHLALEAWDAAYHNAMADGLSPPTARDLAWAAVSDFLS
nr:MAG: capsid protein [Mamastrovirus 3]